MTDSLNKWGIMNMGNQMFLKEIPTFRFNKDDERDIKDIPQIGDTITLEVSTITKEFYRFLSETNQARRVQTPMTGTIPGNPHGNISNGALGFFATFGTARASYIYKEPEENAEKNKNPLPPKSALEKTNNLKTIKPKTSR
jgi:hypothetical protein